MKINSAVGDTGILLVGLIKYEKHLSPSKATHPENISDRVMNHD
jgi:uncharacterized short protein YbdD (DUF466 family)